MTYPQSINHSQAIKLIQQQLQAVDIEAEVLSVAQISGRILAENVSAPIDVPAFDCSRMDGYAINLHHLRAATQGPPYILKTGAAIHATAQSENLLCHELAIPIMTGGKLPADAHAIVLKEQVTVTGDQIQFNELPSKNKYIRQAGSDLRKGREVLKSGQRMTAAHMGLLSSLGLSEVAVYKRPQVALMMTGDELVQPGNSCLPGQIYDANSVMLSTLLREMGCDVHLLETLSDSEAAVNKQLSELKAAEFHLIISVGGVSMGDKDWVPTVLAKQGTVLFHKVRIKPGFPVLFGYLGRALFYGLPGNPVSAYTTICQYVYPAIQHFKAQNTHKLIWRATLSHDLNKPHFRREYLRGYYDSHADGQIAVSVCGKQQSSRIESLADANCFIIMDESQQELKAGSSISIQPFLQFKN